MRPPSPAPDSALYWRSLHYFSLYRLVVGGVLVVAFLLFEPPPFGAERPLPFFLLSCGYVAAGLLLALAVGGRRPAFEAQLGVQVVTDIAFLVVLTALGGGLGGGLGLLLIAPVAAGGLSGSGRLALFYAALAGLAILGEQSLRHLGGHGADFFHAGLLSLSFFAAAGAVHGLTRYALTSERMARERGADLQSLARINRLVIQDMREGVVVVDPAGNVIFRNPEADRLLGLPRAGVLKLAEYSPELARALPAALAEGTPLPPWQPDGGRELCARLTPLKAGSALIYVQDSGRAEAQAQQIKLAALGRLTANIAHEIRNPLGAISQAAELLGEDAPDSPLAARLTNIILDNTRRLNRLVEEVLELNRKSQPRPEAVALDAFLAEFAAEFCQAERLPSGALSVEVSGSPHARFDRAHLQQVLWNLCRNAWRHGRQAPGSVRLIAADALAAGTVQLDVLDDGMGVAPELQAQLFEPFFTTSSRGTGLGLFIAREVCGANGASLDYVEVAPGGLFRICAQGVPT